MQCEDKKEADFSFLPTRFALSMNRRAFLQTHSVCSKCNHVRLGRMAPPNSHPIATHF